MKFLRKCWCRPWRIAGVSGCLFFLLAMARAGEDVWPGQPYVGKDADGQLEVFRLNADGAVCHRWRKPLNGQWSPWSSLGGCFSPGMVAASDAAGQLEVFAVSQTNQTLECIRQTGTNHFEWSSWKNLGRSIVAPVAVASDMEGRLVVFAVDAATRHVQFICQTGGVDGWSPWQDLGGAVEPGIVAVRNKSGRLEIFGVQAGGDALLHCWQLHTNEPAKWSSWASLGGSIIPGFAIGQNRLGLVEVMAVNRTNGMVNRICQTVAGGIPQWTSWSDFGVKAKPGLAVGICGVGRMEVFAIDATNSMLLHRWELYNDSSDQWSKWASLGATARPAPAVGRNEDGNLEVFAADPDDPNIIRQRQQISSSSDWLDWSSLDQPVFEYEARTWQVDEGLPDNLVQAIAQTPDGYLWVGTREGLARFDGVEFTSFSPKTTPALKTSSITALCASVDGVLWIGTDGGGVVCRQNGIFTPFNPPDGQVGANVRVIYQTRDGALWFGTTVGLTRFKNGKLKTYSESDGLVSDVVSHLCEDRDGNLWIATGKGLNRLRRNGVMDSFAIPNGLPDDSVRGICQDKGGRIWIGSNNGLLWFNWFWGTDFYAYNTKYGLSDSFVSAICEDHDGNLWVGTYSGLNRFRDGRFYNQFDNEGLPFDKVTALFVDRESDLWVGSQEGLIRLTPKHFFTYTRREGLTHNNIMSVLQDHTGNVWVATWGGGLNVLPAGNNSGFISANGSTNEFSQGLMLSLCEGHDGSVWAGADFDGGLERWKDGKITRYTAQDGLINAGLRVMHEDATGSLWIGTSRGLCCFKDKKFVNNALTDRLAGETIRDICEDHAGALWFATENGLYCWHSGQLTVYTTKDGLADNTVTALYEDGGHALWIGTGGGGLERFRNGHFTAYSTRQGLFSDEIFDIMEDDEGALWMSCSKGIFRVRKQDFDDLDAGKIQSVASVVFGKSEGMESPQCNGTAKPAGWKTRDGRLWFPTSTGLVTVDPATIKQNNFPPEVFIQSVLANQKYMGGGFGANGKGQPPFSDSPAAAAPPLRVPPGAGDLEFHYTALSLSAPDKNRFKYKLSGVDSGWVDAGVRRVAYYNNLAPGTYRFQVEACNKDGVWNENGASLTLLLRSHYWQTLWFQGLVLAGLITGASGTALYTTRRRMQRKFALLEQQQAFEKERVRIARDMHDQIGAGLTQIGLLGEFARREADKKGTLDGHADKICDAARELAQTLDEIVWMVNPRNDTLNKLGVYLAAYAEEFFQSTSIRCRLDIPPGLPDLPLSTELRHNLFMAVKESLNNVVKHSGASEVWVRLVPGPSGLEIFIEDNGAGFSVNAANLSRNGLSNMRERVEEVGGVFQIISQPRNGTGICLRVPLQYQSLKNDSQQAN
jgi:ligand-binding sensor domain-containing protein/signal transduction histidine kinase